MEPNAAVELSYRPAGRPYLARLPSVVRAPSLMERLQARWARAFDDFCDVVAPCPWGSSVGQSSWHHSIDARGEQANAEAANAGKLAKAPLYTAEERRRRDASPWTMVQAILAPLQFLAFGVSLALVVRYLATGDGYAITTFSILVKTAALFAIMITGSIWEKVVFGKWLFARSFFWEDVFSILVLGLQGAYLCALLFGWGSPRQQMMIAIAAYAAYAINASQFLLKLRAARLEGAAPVARLGLAV